MESSGRHHCWNCVPPDVWEDTAPEKVHPGFLRMTQSTHPNCETVFKITDLNFSHFNDSIFFR